MARRVHLVPLLSVVLGSLEPSHARAEPSPTPGFPEAVVQWGTQAGETCDDIAKALYGSPKFAHLLLRYNRLSCAKPLPEGLTLVLPARVTTLPTARLRSMHPDVQTRPSGGGWQSGSSGQPLDANSSVQTQEQGRADIEFVDRSRVFLAPRTLVVIFDTASQSRVSKGVPPRVEVQAGEVQAGLAALRGEPVEVSVPGGGRVTAASRDTVIARQGERTTVAVFEGKAAVTSGGKQVEVPLHHGTRFVGARPPDPPRPLPPAPRLAAATSGELTIEGVLRASWEPVASAASYRVEVAREADFAVPLVREEVPADVLSFRAEKLAAGRYFLRVRAIDREDYLGIATTRAVTMLVVQPERARLEGTRLIVRPGARLAVQAPPGVEVAIDDGAFGPLPAALSLPTPLPRKLRLRADAAHAPVDLSVERDALRGTLTAQDEGPGRVRLRWQPDGRTAAEALAEAHPRVRVAGAPTSVALEPVDERTLAARLDVAPGSEAAYEVIDDQGQALGEARWRATLAPSAPPVAPPAPPLLGVAAPLWAHQPDAAPLWLSPRAPTLLALATLARPDDPAGVQLDARGSGALGRLGLDLALRTRLAGEATTDGTVWGGARVPVVATAQHGFELGGMLHGAVPTTARSPAPMLEPALAMGGRAGRVTWVVDLGGRVRLTSDDERATTARGQGFVVAGVSFQAATWLRAYLAADGRALAATTRPVRAGGVLGLEAGTRWFAGVAGRGGLREPSADGLWSVQLSLGLRDTLL